MNIDKILNYLDSNKVKFENIAHKTVYTAFDIAQTLKTKMSEIGKPVVIKADGKYSLVVIPADRQIDIAKLKKQLKAKKIELVSEKVMAQVLNLKNESVSAFGKLRDLQVYVDKNIVKNKNVILATNNFTNSIKMAVKDFVQMEQAVVGEISKTKEFKKVKAQVKKKVALAKAKILKKPKVKKIVKKVAQVKKQVAKIKKQITKTKKEVSKISAKKSLKKIVKKSKK